MAARGLRNNNPGNIVYGDFARRYGATGSDGTFARFPTPEAGIQAMYNLSRIHENQGLTTIAQRITKWAPPGDNDTAAYIRRVSAELGIPANQSFNISDPTLGPAFIDAMITVENGSNPYAGEVVQQAQSAALGTPQPGASSPVVPGPMARFIDNAVSGAPDVAEMPLPRLSPSALAKFNAPGPDEGRIEPVSSEEPIDLEGEEAGAMIEGLAPDEPSPLRVKLRKGDTLWDVAEERLGDGRRWKEIATANGIAPTEKAARRLVPGTVLDVPGGAQPPTPQARPAPGTQQPAAQAPVPERPEIPRTSPSRGVPQMPMAFPQPDLDAREIVNAATPSSKFYTTRVGEDSFGPTLDRLASWATGDPYDPFNYTADQLTLASPDDYNLQNVNRGAKGDLEPTVSRTNVPGATAPGMPPLRAATGPEQGTQVGDRTQDQPFPTQGAPTQAAGPRIGAGAVITDTREQSTLATPEQMQTSFDADMQRRLADAQERVPGAGERVVDWMRSVVFGPDSIFSTGLTPDIRPGAANVVQPGELDLLPPAASRFERYQPPVVRTKDQDRITSDMPGQQPFAPTGGQRTMAEAPTQQPSTVAAPREAVTGGAPVARSAADFAPLTPTAASRGLPTNVQNFTIGQTDQGGSYSAYDQDGWHVVATDSGLATRTPTAGQPTGREVYRPQEGGWTPFSGGSTTTTQPGGAPPAATVPTPQTRPTTTNTRPSTTSPYATEPTRYTSGTGFTGGGGTLASI